MNDLDAALDRAFTTLLARLQADPDEALRRARRAATSIHRRPITAWSLAIRATDTRLEAAAHIDDDHAARAGRPHEVLISSSAVLELCAPVRIPWPGLDWTIAARRLGRPRSVMRNWIEKGVFQVRYDNARSVGKIGLPVPHIWTHAPLNPAAPLGRAPDPIWGTLWQSLADDIPDDHAFTYTRIPRYTDPNRGVRSPFRGYAFQCPGRLHPIPDGLRVPPHSVGGSATERSEPVRGTEQPASAPPPLLPPAGEAAARSAAAPVKEQPPRSDAQSSLCPSPVPDGGSVERSETKGVQQLASEAPSPAPGGRGNGTQCRGAGQRQTASAASPQLCISNSASAPQVITRNNHRYLHIPCNRLADVIYLPIPPITIPEALGALDLLADLNIPPPPDYRDHPFACAHCWQMRRTTLANYAGWNDFVSYISAGLLYGHEVERTSAEAQPRRKRPYAPRPGRAPSQRRAQVLQGLLAGQTYNQIARALGVSYHTVHLHTKKLYKQHNVHSRTELQAMLCATNSVHITANDWRMPSELPTANGVLR